MQIIDISSRGRVDGRTFSRKFSMIILEEIFSFILFDTDRSKLLHFSILLRLSNVPIDFERIRFLINEGLRSYTDTSSLRLSLLPRLNLHIPFHRRKHKIGQGEDPEADKRRTEEKIGGEIGLNYEWSCQKGGEAGRRE